MQDGQLSNTLFEEQLNQSDWGKFQPGTSLLSPTSATPKTSSLMTADELTQSLLTQGDMVNKQSQKLNSPYKETQISPLILDLTGRFNKQVVGADTEDIYGQAQSNWDKLGNGVLKGLSLAGTTFLQGTLGLVYGVAQAIGQGKLSSLYDNDLSNSLNDFNNSLENSLPNYYTARERAADWWEPANVFTANFLWDKLVKNLGFSIGAIYSGAVVTKMLQLVPEAFALSKAGALSKVADTMESTLSTIPSLQRANAAASEIMSTSKAINTLSKTFSPTERFVVSTLGAATEGGIEALQGVNEWRDQKIKEYKDEYNTTPTGATLDKINSMAQDLGNVRFGMNIALLTATNYVQLPKILSSSYKESKLVANGIERSLNPIKKNAETGLFESALPSSTTGKLLHRAKNVASLFFSPTEAFEETSQYAIQRGVENYYNKAYKGEGRDWLNSLSEGYRRALSDKEGLESLLIGGVSGGIQQAGFISKAGIGKSGEIAERGVLGYGGEKAKNTQDFLTLLNSSKLTMKSDGWLEEMAKSTARGINLQIEGENYIRQGDILESKDNEFDYQHNYLTPRIKYGRMDLVKDDINTYRTLAATSEGWNKLKQMGIANPNDTTATFLTRLANFEKHAENVNSLYQSLNVRYGGIRTKEGVAKYSNEAIDKMVYAASKIADYDTRIPQVNNSLSLSGISTQPVIDHIILNNRVSEASTKEALDQINVLDTTSDTKDQLKSDLRDLIELALRRKSFIKDYDQLKENPEKFIPDSEIEIPSTATINKKAVNVGQTYSLTDPLLREGNKLSISPKLTVLSTTLTGELEVQSPTGERTFRKPSQLKYDLSDSNTTDAEYNRLAEKAIDKVIGSIPEANTLDQKVSYINARNEKELTDKVEAQIIQDTKEYTANKKKIQAENEKLAKDKTLQAKLKAAQDALDKKSGIEPKNYPTEEELAIADKQPKAPLPSFLSKEADFYDQANPKPHQKRRLQFLSLLPTFTQKKAAQINVLAITAKNEAAYGLTGLIQWVKNDIQNSRMDEEQRAEYLNPDGTLKASQEPIVKLYTIKEGNIFHIVSPEGTKLSPLTGDVISDLTTNGVFGVFHSSVEGVYKFGPRQGQNNWSGGYTEDEVKSLKAQFTAWRERVLTLPDSPIYPIQSTSKGVVLRDETNKPVTDTSLASEEDILNREKIITIPTIPNQITIGNTSYDFPVGVPLLTNGANVDFLNNRTFTPEEATTIFQLLRRRVENSSSPEAERIENYLSSILYLRSPKDATEAISDSQIFHTTLNSPTRQYFFGNSFAVDFNTFAIDAAKDEIISFFTNYFVKANNKILTEKSLLGFEEATIDEKGDVTFKQHPSYQHFLLSTKAHATPFLQTKARKSISSDDPSIIHRYTTLASSEFEFVSKAKPISEAEIPASSTEPLKKSLFGKKKKTEETPQATPTPSPTNIVYYEKQKLWEGIYTNKEGKLEGVQGHTKEEVEAKIAKLTGIPTTTTEEKSVDEKKKEGREKFKGKDPSIDKSEFSVIDEAIDYAPIDINKELSYISERSPFSIEILKNVIKTSEGIFAWGQFKGMLISLYNQAKVGTGYHELFEGVWKVFTTPEQKQAIFSEFKSRNGEFTAFDGKEYQRLSYSQATPAQAKETLANEFADYVLSKQEPTGSLLSRWFKQLWDLIKSIFTGRISVIDSLFKKIDSGAYKSASPIYIDEETEYSFVDLPYQDQYSTIRGIALEVVQQAINPTNTSSISLTEWEESEVSLAKMYDGVYSRLKEVFEEDIYSDKMGVNTNEALLSQYENYWTNLKENWGQVIAATNEYLRSFSIVEGIQDDEGNISRVDRDDYSNRDYVDDRKYFMNDARNTASRSVKLLFATLPETIFTATGIQSRRTVSTLMQEQVNYAKTFNSLLTQLIPLNTFHEKMAKLEELSQKFPNFKRLYTRLTTPSNTETPNSVLNDWKLKVRFYQVMAKQEPTPWIQYNQSNGSSFTQTANLESSKKLVVQSWIDGMKSIASSNTSNIFSINDRGELIIKTIPLKYNISSPEEKFEFLRQLGIVFTREMYDTLNKAQAKDFNEAVAGLSYQLKKSPQYILDNAKSLNAIRNLETIAQASISSGNDFETMFINIENERQAIFVSTNAISRMVNSLNNSENRTDLIKAMPQLEPITDSIYLNNILYNQAGERTSFNIDMGYIQGTIDEKGKSVPGAKLSLFQRLTQEINQNLNQRYYVLVPADSKTQWLASLKNLVSYQNVATNSNDYQERVKGLFTAYYQTELDSYNGLKEVLSERELNSRQGVFKDISQNYTLSPEDVYTSIGEFFNGQIRAQRDELAKYNVISPNRGKSTFSWKAIDGEFAKSNNINPQAIESQTINNILTFRTINYAINNVEMHKMFFGNTLAYKDAKRWKLFMSPREISIYDTPEFNTFLNEEMNKNTPTPLLGNWKFSDYIQTAMMKDVTIINDTLSALSTDYATITATDAQAWSTLTASRERRLKGGSWTEKDEDQFQYSQALDRQLMFKDGILQNTNDKLDTYYPSSLKTRDAERVLSGNPDVSYIYVEKPILSGHVQIGGEWSPITDKFSIASFSYSSIRNTNFRAHYIKMIEQGIGYIIAESGRKVGKTEPNTFYTPEGDVNEAPYTGITPVPFSAFGVQTDTSKKKETQTRGSQITKLIIVNLYDNGIPITPKAGELAAQNLALLREQTELGYQKLLKSIGAEDVDGRYRITNKSKIVNLLKDELLKREVADSIKELISINPDTDDLIVPFEALPNYIQIKNILYSFVDKYILRPKVSGAPKVQVSGALMEKYGVKKSVVNGKDVYHSSSLKFYTKEEPWMEVMLPAWVSRKLRKAGLKWETTEELYGLFSSSPDAKQLLSGIGFRIPTQELNSVENIHIAGFLPEEFGDTIIVPEEITTKAGSDFDIDKLNTYLQNIYIDDEKKIRVVPFFGIGDEAKDKLKKWISEDVKKDFLLNISKPDPDALDRLDFDTDEEILALNKGEGEDISAFYSQSIENEYYRNMTEILSLPENFERLVTPNTSDTLKNIRDQLVELSDVFNSALNPTIISPVFMLKTRHEGLSVKDLVGIAAVAQTGIASSQLSSIVVDPSRLKSLSFREKSYLPNNAQPLLPHNSINDRATISSIKDVEGNYITDNNSQFINGTVDVFNDAFLPQINYNRRTAPLYHLMTRLGIPNSKSHPIISFFLNQPAIRQYLGRLDIKDKGFIIDNASIGETFKQFSGGKTISTFPKSLSDITSLLRDNIKSYYNGVPLTLQQKGEQTLIFREFLKYATLANNLFRFQQGANYDTARMNDPNSMYFKEYQYTQAHYNNIFSDVSSYLTNSHIGDQRRAMMNVNQAMSDVLPVQSELVQSYFATILSRIAPKYISLDAKNKIARKLEESLLNFLIQTKTGINNSLSYMMVDAKTALINQLKTIKKTSPDTDVIWGNLILKQLIPSIKGRTALSTKNITLAVKPRDVASKNMYNKAFQELYDNPKTQELARSLIKISFLQNGVSNSRISFKDSIPASLYAATINPVVGELQSSSSLQQFIDSNTFYKNNWNDEDIVPVVYSDEFPLAGFKPLNDYVKSLKAQSAIPSDAPTPSTIWVGGFNSYSPFLTHIYQGDPNEAEEIPVSVKRLFQRVQDESGQAIVREIEEEDGSTSRKTLFIQVSALGDADRAQEHYETIHSSVFQNGFLNPKIEISPQDLYEFVIFGGQGEAETEPETTPPTPVATPVTPKLITEVIRASKKEKYTITTPSGEKIEKEGYKLTIKEYPRFQGFITGSSKTFWQVDELVTSKHIPVDGDTIKEVLQNLPASLNKAFAQTQNKEILNQIGLFIEPEEGTQNTC